MPVLQLLVLVLLPATSPVFISQVLIVSYETFRMHADKFQGENACDLLICDEAHRLKNKDTLTNRVRMLLPANQEWPAVDNWTGTISCRELPCSSCRQRLVAAAVNRHAYSSQTLDAAAVPAGPQQPAVPS